MSITKAFQACRVRGRAAIISATLVVTVLMMLAAPGGVLAGTSDRANGGSRCGVDRARSSRVSVMHCDGQTGVAVAGTVQQSNTTLASVNQTNAQVATASGAGSVQQTASNQATLDQKTHQVAVALFGNVQQTVTNVAAVSQSNVQSGTATGGSVQQTASNSATIEQRTHQVAHAVRGDVVQSATNVASVTQSNVQTASATRLDFRHYAASC